MCELTPFGMFGITMSMLLPMSCSLQNEALVFLLCRLWHLLMCLGSCGTFFFSFYLGSPRHLMILTVVRLAARTCTMFRSLLSRLRSLPTHISVSTCM